MTNAISVPDAHPTKSNISPRLGAAIASPVTINHIMEVMQKCPAKRNCRLSSGRSQFLEDVAGDDEEELVTVEAVFAISSTSFGSLDKRGRSKSSIAS